VDPLLAEVLRLATGELGVREQGGRNRGPRVETYLASVGAEPGKPWCAAFVYWLFAEAAVHLGYRNPLARTGGVLRHWHCAPLRAHLPAELVRRHPDKLRAGAIFVIDHGEGRGHTGLVSGPCDGAGYPTIEGNTCPEGSRDGDGVYARRRLLDDRQLIGFLDYSGLAQKIVEGDALLAG
jgi:hypothetical protein